MTARSAYAGDIGLQLCAPVSTPVERSQSMQDNEHEGGKSRARSVRSRASIHAVNTLRRSPIFASIGDADVAGLNARCLWRRIPTGEYLVHEPADRCTLSVVTNGRVRVVRMVNGREIILRDIEEGVWFGSLSAIDGDLRSPRIVAVSDAIVARVPPSVFRETTHSLPQFCEQVLMGLSVQIQSMHNRLSEQISLSTRERLCVEAEALAAHGDGSDRSFPSHEELGAQIGGLCETVTRLLIALEQEGLISRSRSAVALLDVPRLRTIAAHGNDA